jgi:hypothetical protein
MGRIRMGKWCQFIIYQAVREARGRRRHPKLHGPFIFLALVPTLGPSTYSTNPSRSAYRSARMLPLLIRAAAARAGLFGKPVVLCWSPGGESPHIPLEPVCIHSLWTCTFPVQVIIYLKHYLYSCTLQVRVP